MPPTRNLPQWAYLGGMQFPRHSDPSTKVLKNRIRHFVIDGEAVVLGVDGVSDFEALYSRQCDDQVQLYALPGPIRRSLADQALAGEESRDHKARAPRP